MAADQHDGMPDLEKELTCSICTDVLYQPLTLLDCLHTFCGSCLREWFAWQASNAKTLDPYTCPSCRASVRGTRPNATVTTLLDMLLRTQPEKSKSLGDRQEIAKAYKPGDNVIPPVQIDQDSDDSENERMLEEARQLSLQDQDPERRAGRAGQHARHRRRHEATPRTTYLNYRSEELGRAQEHARSSPSSRQVEHQSSLRSLLSASDIESHSQEVQEDIMRQIIDEGLLDGIDLNNLTPGQEEEVTERIAQAFRRRQRQRSTDRPRRDRSPQPPRSSAPRQRTHVRSDSGSNQSTHERPPASRPHLLNPPADHERQRDRSSSQTSQRSNRSRQQTEQTVQAASRSVTDLSERPRTKRSHRPRRISHGDRSATDPEGLVPSVRASRDRATSGIESPTHRVVLPPSQRVTSGTRSSSQVYGTNPANPLESLRSRNGPSNSSSPALVSTTTNEQDRHVDRRPTTSSATVSGTIALPACSDPSISCSRCNKPNIQHTVHYHCSKCASGDFDLCKACYRAGKGCLHWFGFGYAAQIRFQKSAPPNNYPPDTESPHVLTARRYRQRDGYPNQTAQDNGSSPRLEEGLFCEGCSEFANPCYWHCGICLEGAWGYCNTCVQQGKHCTHPLESLGHRSSNKGAQAMYFLGQESNELYPAPLNATNTATSGPLQSPHQGLATTTILPNVTDPAMYTPLSLATYCDICHRSIPASHTRFHCYACSAGDYDICTPCYHNLVSSGKISTENGPQGWRRCLRGHRMSVVGFEDREGGQRRIVVREMVGGWALKEEEENNNSNQNNSLADPKWSWREADGKNASVPSQVSHVQRTTTNLLPPDGGVGLVVLALWSYFPAKDVEDELAFPRNAEIREVEDINGDWFWGVYAGSKGLFPGNYGRIV